MENEVHNKWIIIGLALSIFGFMGYAVFIAPNQSFDKALTYLQTTPIQNWHPTDYTYLYYFWKLYPQTINPVVLKVANKTDFETEYPFVFSLFNQIKNPPSKAELADPVGQFLLTYDKCQSFDDQIYFDYSVAQNSFDYKNPIGFYSGSHAVLLTNLIRKTYAGCGNLIDVPKADSAMNHAVQGLSIPFNQGILFPDAFLEQECARALATGNVDPQVSNYLIQTQDPNGGWNAYDATNPNQPIEINPHTTISGLCILGVQSGVFS